MQSLYFSFPFHRSYFALCQAGICSCVEHQIANSNGEPPDLAGEAGMLAPSLVKGSGQRNTGAVHAPKRGDQTTEQGRNDFILHTGNLTF
uniref:Uncharacterized protein n=1 Tax=Anguilla anguilla TaxID=7936 RepID=A0A0E9R8P7_ANGAN